MATPPPSFATLYSIILGLFLAYNVKRIEGRTFFVFGDSLVDSGNNNYLATSARADSPPYGIDYPTRRPTGRFSNGLNIPDIISESIGIQEPPLPYLNPQLTGQRLLVGANFASAGVGILNDTGIQFVNIIRIAAQLEYFQQYQQRVRALIGADRTKQLVNRALVLMTLGGNDFVNNYYLVPYSARSRQYSLPDYVKFLISEYQKVLMNLVTVSVIQPSSRGAKMYQAVPYFENKGKGPLFYWLKDVEKLYTLGVGRVLVTGTGPMGCVPAELAQRSRNGQCDAELQRAAGLFNPQLTKMLQNLNKKIGKNVFIAANTELMHSDFISNPGAYGFVTSKIACCGQGPYNGLGLCTPASNLCPNRDIYAFWDAFHPSEKANKIIVKQILTGTTEYMTPMNLSTILALDSEP